MYNFDKKIDRCNTDCIKWDTFEASNISKDTLPMFIADMDFEVLPEISQALDKRVRQVVYGYTTTTDHYYQAIQDWFKNRHHWDIQKDWIISMNGVVPAINAGVQALTHIDDSIMIFSPVYMPFKAAIESNQRRCVESHLVLENGRYTIDYADMENKIVSENVKALIFCNPHNPVGRVWTKDELTRLVDICVKHHVWIISDEIHHDFVFKPNVYTPVANINEQAAMMTITCTAPGKTFNLAGLQTANTIISNIEVKEKFMKILDSWGCSHGSNMMGVAACEAAYTHGALWVDELVDYVQGNMTYVESYIQKNIPHVQMIHPEGLYLAWIDLRALNMTNEALRNFLIEKAKVWANAGEWFGADGSGFARINLACPRSQVEKFVKQLEQAVKALYVGV